MFESSRTFTLIAMPLNYGFQGRPSTVLSTALLSCPDRQLSGQSWTKLTFKMSAVVVSAVANVAVINVARRRVEKQPLVNLDFVDSGDCL